MFYLLALRLQYQKYRAQRTLKQCDKQRKENTMEAEVTEVTCSEEPRILEEIQVEELAIDGICGVY